MTLLTIQREGRCNAFGTRASLRVPRAPGVPHALFGRKIYQRLGRMASRDANACLGLGGRHSGMRHLAQARNPYFRSWLWIPGSRFARPGMTALNRIGSLEIESRICTGAA